MTKDELILKGSTKVRGNSNLMSIYIDLFTKELGRKPRTCCGGYDGDWRLFVSGSGTQIQPVTFRLKKVSDDILVYRKNGKKISILAKNMTPTFAKEYLTNGTPEEIELRKKLFAELPKI